MNALDLFLSNIISIPILCFMLGFFLSTKSLDRIFSSSVNGIVTAFLLFSIGLKGGEAILKNVDNELYTLIFLMGAWGFIQPILCFAILRRLTKIETKTLIAISACFGSISVMTFVAATTFLDKLGVNYEGFVIAALAIMELPAVISGLFIYRLVDRSLKTNFSRIFIHTFLNKAILFLLIGMTTGVLLSMIHHEAVIGYLLLPFKAVLSFFLAGMGYLVGKKRDDFKNLSWTLGLFAIITPIIGATIGIFLSLIFHLDVGTGFLISILMASASYIAVPAALKLSIPEANEGIYIPLSLGIAFPFNVIFGIPLYFQMACKFLK